MKSYFILKKMTALVVMVSGTATAIVSGKPRGARKLLFVTFYYIIAICCHTHNVADKINVCKV